MVRERQQRLFNGNGDPPPSRQTDGLPGGPRNQAELDFAKQLLRVWAEESERPPRPPDSRRAGRVWRAKKRDWWQLYRWARMAIGERVPLRIFARGIRQGLAAARQTNKPIYGFGWFSPHIEASIQQWVDAGKPE